MSHVNIFTCHNDDCCHTIAGHCRISPEKVMPRNRRVREELDDDCPLVFDVIVKGLVPYQIGVVDTGSHNCNRVATGT